MPATVPLPRSAVEVSRRGDVLAVISGTRHARMIFQPLVDLQQGVAVGFEALARLGARLSTAPGPWFAAAARGALTGDLEAVLVTEALAARSTLPTATFLTVNVSPAVLSHPAVLQAFGRAGELDNVVVELTENSQFGDERLLRDAVAALRDRGARFALDDVGVGWAGLKQVADLRPDIVKLDRHLVAGAPADPIKQAIAQMMLDLCARLGVTLLVEGVETLEELDLFARMGIPLAQGFVFGQPSAAPRRLIDDDIAVRLKFRAGLRRRQDVVAGLVEVAGRVEVGDTPTRAVSGAQPADPDPVVVVDGAGRPVAIRVETGQVLQVRPVTVVTATEQVASAAERAMSRPAADRALPLVCVDSAGRHVGIVPVEALVRALAAEPNRASAVSVVLP